MFSVTWEKFEEQFRKKYLSEENLERKLNEFLELKYGTKIVLEYEARFVELLRYDPHLNIEKLKLNKFLYGLNPCIKETVCMLMEKTLHEAMQRDIIGEEEFLGRVEENYARNPFKPFIPHFHNKTSHGKVHGSSYNPSFSKNHEAQGEML
jgi:hypothetical protein